MKQPDSLDIGTKMDVVRHRLQVFRIFTGVLIGQGIISIPKQRCIRFGNGWKSMV